MHFLIVGVGSIGERHLRNFLRIDGVHCSIAEINAELREKIAGEYAVEASYGDYREADLAVFDGVVICVPVNLHVPMATEIVKAGKHVLTEKPLAMLRDGIDELKRLRDEKGVVVSVAFTYRCHPLILEMRERVNAGELGNVQAIFLHAGQYWPRMRKDYPPVYAQKRETGGGVIPDHMIHQVNAFEWMFGPTVEVSAHHWSLALKDIATEDMGVVTQRFENGAIANIEACLFQRDTIMFMQIVGDRGTIRMRGDCDTLEVFSDETGEWSSGHATAPDRDDMFRDQAIRFIDCIQGRDTPRCTIEEGEQTMRTIAAALKSADGDGRCVSVQDGRGPQPKGPILRA